MEKEHGPSLFRLTIEVGDLQRGTAFYRDLLAQEGRAQMGGRHYFVAGAVTLQVVEADRLTPGPKALYFAVYDLEEVHRRAARLDCLSMEKVHGTPAGEAVVRPWGERSFYCDDPWGNPLCFVDAGTIYAG